MQEPSTKTGHNQRGPSVPAYGGVVVMSLLVAMTILLTYTMLPLPGQRELGALNYVAAAFFVVLTVILLKRFRPARVTDEDPTAKPRVRSRARP